VPLVVLVVALAAILLPAAATADTEAELLRSRIEQLDSGVELRIGDASIAAVRLIPEFYQRRGFRPAWGDPEDVRTLMGRVSAAHEHGLDPADYHVTELRRLMAAEAGPATRVDLDILLTDSLLRLGYHLRFGKIAPGDLDPNWNLDRNLGGRDPATMLEEALGRGSIDALLDTLTPTSVYYSRLKAALARYREIAGAGGWPMVPEGPALEPGMRDVRVALMRRRLEITGDLQAAPTGEPEVYDEAVGRAVEQFQRRHHLGVDGVVGPRTIGAMNVPAGARVDQIRVNLERARWVLHVPDDNFIVVNIAGFHVFVVEDGEISWNARAQVGKLYRKTPVFRSTMKYIVFNPTWTVPPTILRNDILPEVKKDPGYLKKKDIEVLDQSGKVLDALSIDWQSVSARRFPYILRQRPGPKNALGLVKFIFPNEHFVFLHDTPSRALFDRVDRTFSSGCIRVDRPMELAEHLLRDPVKWNAGTIAALIESGETKTVFLPEPLTVMLLYWTVGVPREDVVDFMGDVYDRDGRVLKALGAEFAYRPVQGVPAYLDRDGS
jgi:murein L,D-transpeptidase YcbB/YkuD